MKSEDSATVPSAGRKKSKNGTGVSKKQAERDAIRQLLYDNELVFRSVRDVLDLRLDAIRRLRHELKL